MNFNQLETVLAVADAGSFSKASRMLYVAAQSLMQQVGAVEAELGFKLFDRTTRGVALTKAGRAFCDGERQVLGNHRAVVEQARQMAGGVPTLRIGLPAGVKPVFVMGVCRRFAARHPEVRIQYVQHSRSEMPGAFLSGEVDVFMDIGLEDDLTSRAKVLFPVEQYCLVASDNPLASHLAIDPLSLCAMQVGVWESLDRYRRLFDFLEACGPGSDNPRLTPRSVHRNMGEALSLCADGGVLVTSRPVVELLRETLVTVPLDYECGIVYSVTVRNAYDPVQAAFVEIARDLCDSKENPWRRQGAFFLYPNG